LPLWKAHRIAHVVMDRCRARLGAMDVVVHAEPPAAVQRADPDSPARSEAE
jgi:hypothetical protein